jgi:hypothetical protein
MEGLVSSMSEEELKTARERFEKYNEMCELYNENEEFRRFVDKSCKDYGLHKDICLLHKTVQDVGDYYKNKEAEHANDIPPCACQKEYAEDKAC